jgi:hypothetical protein
MLDDGCPVIGRSGRPLPLPLPQPQLRKVRPVVPAVPGQEAVGVDEGVGTNEEIGHDVLAWVDAGPASRAMDLLRRAA